MRKGVVANVMEQASEPIFLDFVLGEFGASGIQRVEQESHDVANAQGVGEARKIGRRIHQVGKAEVLNVPQPLEDASVNHPRFQVS